MARTVWSASEYLDSLATESTRSNYKTGLKQFFIFISDEKLPRKNFETRLDEISKKYFETEQEYDKDYVNFQNKIKKKYAPKTVELRMLAIRGLFEFNEIQIPEAILTRLNGRKAVEPVSEEKVPRREEVKLILQHLPLHIKTYALFILSGGLRPGEPLDLELDDIEDEDGLTRINLKAKNTKTGQKRWTYITPEANTIYQLWLESRKQFIKTTEKSIKDNDAREKYRKCSINKVFPFTYNTANKVWNTAVKQAGLMKRDDDTNRVTLRLHNLRKYFSTRGKWGDRDIPDFLQGHIGGVRAVYQRYDQATEIVREEYRKAIPSLTIEDYADDSRVEELESKLAENRQKSNELNENISYLVNENRQLNDRLRTIEQELRLQKIESDNGLRNTNEKLQTQIEEMRSILVDIINNPDAIEKLRKKLVN
ncbi:MAG: tyrosine-type recombinase/integrase [Candidatus Hodarchaeales archaeon]